MPKSKVLVTKSVCVYVRREAKKQGVEEMAQYGLRSETQGNTTGGAPEVTIMQESIQGRRGKSPGKTGRLKIASVKSKATKTKVTSGEPMMKTVKKEGIEKNTQMQQRITESYPLGGGARGAVVEEAEEKELTSSMSTKITDIMEVEKQTNEGEVEGDRQGQRDRGETSFSTVEGVKEEHGSKVEDLRGRKETGKVR